MLRITDDDGLRRLTLDRPEKLNALSFALIDALSAALEDAARATTVRAVVLTGTGRAFSAGADVADLAGALSGGVSAALEAIVARGQGLTRRIETFPKPLVVAVNGLAHGGGCEIVEAAPLAVAAAHATFAKPEIRLGFPPPFGGTQRLARHIGRKRALEMILTGVTIDAARAEALGLVNRVAPADRLAEEAAALARAASAHAPEATQACLAAVTRGLNLPIDEGLAVEAAWFGIAAASGTASAGASAFLRRPRGSG